jgi:hypothetical protein
MDSLLPKSKVCKKCGKEKLLEEFYKDKTCKYGRTRNCKLCFKQYREANKEKLVAYREANKEKAKEYQKQYREANKEKCAEKRKQYYQDNKEQVCEKAKQYHEANKEKRKQYNQENKEKIAEWGRQYREKNKEQINKRFRNRRKNDEQYRIRCCLSRTLLHTLNKIGKTKKASVLAYIGCPIEDLVFHLDSTKNPEWGDDLHIDHIIPSSLFDHTNEEEVKKCWNWRNLRYLPAEENLIKGGTLDMDLVKSYGIEDLLPLEQKLRDGN